MNVINSGKSIIQIIHYFSFDNGLLVYGCTAEGRLQFKRKVSLPSPVVDYDYDNEGNILALLATNQPGANVVLIDPKTGASSPTPDSFVASFFSGIGDKFKPQPLDHYYKRWFDNVVAYQENKEKRMAPPAGKREVSQCDSTEMKRLCLEKSAS